MQKLPRPAVLHLPLILYPQSSILVHGPHYSNPQHAALSPNPNALNSKPVTIQAEGQSHIDALLLTFKLSWGASSTYYCL